MGSLVPLFLRRGNVSDAKGQACCKPCTSFLDTSHLCCGGSPARVPSQELEPSNLVIQSPLQPHKKSEEKTPSENCAAPGAANATVAVLLDLLSVIEK